MPPGPRKLPLSALLRLLADDDSRERIAVAATASLVKNTLRREIGRSDR